MMHACPTSPVGAVEFNVYYGTQLGQRVYVCGSCAELGEWNGNFRSLAVAVARRGASCSALCIARHLLVVDWWPTVDRLLRDCFSSQYLELG